MNMNTVYIEDGRYVRIETRMDIIVVACRMFIGATLVLNAVPLGASSGLLLARYALPSVLVPYLFETLLVSTTIAIVLRSFDLLLSRYEKRVKCPS
jgi:hypothetical protein